MVCRSRRKAGCIVALDVTGLSGSKQLFYRQARQDERRSILKRGLDEADAYLEGGDSDSARALHLFVAGLMDTDGDIDDE